MLFMDDPDHRRIRSLVVQAFTRCATACARERVQQIVDELLDKMAAVDGAVDIISWLASPFPITVIAEIRNRSSRPWRFQTLVRRRCIELRPDARPDVAERVATSSVDLRAYLTDALRRRRIDPGDDLISTLIAVQDADGDQLSDDEAVSAIAILLLAGNITTTDLIGNGLLALLQHPDRLDALRAATSLIDNAVEEMLRYDPPVLATDRIAMAEMSVGGCPIRKCEWIWPVLSSANRDPAMHPAPDRFDTRRENIHHVSFGKGPHLCVGAPLARMEAQIALGSLIKPSTNIAVADPAARLRFKLVPGFRGHIELPVLLS